MVIEERESRSGRAGEAREKREERQDLPSTGFLRPRTTQ
jgi:hypothetical protein